MIRYISVPVLAFALLPIALLLLAFGIYAIPTKKKRGIWLKLALLANSSLLLILGSIGCDNAKSDVPDDEFVMCYRVAASDITEVPKSFEESGDWQTLENSLSNLEYYIETSDFRDDVADEFYSNTGNAINGLEKSGLISDDDSSILREYCVSRYKYYIHMVGGATCYKPMPAPTGKDAVKGDIIKATDELHSLYKEYKIDTPAYDNALANLEKQLELYTGKEDNAVLRQLLLDLTDDMTGEYWTG